MLLNTEMGLVIESPALAAQIRNIVEQDNPWRSYRLSLDPEGHLQWEAPPLWQWHHALNRAQHRLVQALGIAPVGISTARTIVINLIAVSAYIKPFPMEKRIKNIHNKRK